MKRLAHIDSLRAVAVILVIWHHIFQDYSNVTLPRYLLPVRFFFIEYGASGVQIFFCLSGFIILMINIEEKQKFDFWKFLRSRYTRLVPGIIFLGAFSIPILGTRKWLFSVLPSITLIDPSIYNKISGVESFSWFSNVMWTLFSEIRFYVIFAFVFWIFKKKSINQRLIVLISILSIAKILVILTQSNFLETFFQLLLITNDSSYFILGMVLALVFNRRDNRRLRNKFTGVSVVILMSLFLEKYFVFQIDLEFAFLAPMLAILVLWKVENPLIQKVSKYIGEPSYISYLTHLHFIFIFRLIGFKQNPFLELFLLPVIIFALSYFVHLKIELPAIKFLRSKF